MEKAFIFDMDGVIVDSEKLWQKNLPGFFNSYFGANIAKKIIGKTYGVSMGTVFQWANQYGFYGDSKSFKDGFNNLAQNIYQKAKITEGIEDLITTLKRENFKLGLVSCSPLRWIYHIIKKINCLSMFNEIISVDDRSDLRSKPSPDGYIFIMNKLSVLPQKTIVIEDSPVGILSAKSSGALVICLKQFQPTNYFAKGAHVYVENIKQLIQMVELI